MRTSADYSSPHLLINHFPDILLSAKSYHLCRASLAVAWRPSLLDGIFLPRLHRSAAPPTLILVPVRQYTRLLRKGLITQVGGHLDLLAAAIAGATQPADGLHPAEGLFQPACGSIGWRRNPDVAQRGRRSQKTPGRARFCAT